MTSTVPTGEPDKIHLGDTVTWEVSESDYPAPGYLVKYTFAALAGGHQVTVSCTGDGSTHTLLIASDEWAGWVEGVYLWRRFADDDAATPEITTLGTGRLTVADPLTSAEDRQQWLERVIAALEAHIEGRAVDAELSVSVAPPGGVSRTVSMLTMQELIQARDGFKEELRQLLQADELAQGKSAKRIYVQM